MNKDTHFEGIINAGVRESLNADGAWRASFHCEPWRVPPGLVVGCQTRLLDIYTPTPLLAITPAVNIRCGTIQFCLDEDVCAETPRRRDLMLGTQWRFKRAVVKTPESAIVFDARRAGINNIAHLLQDAVGPALAGLKILGIRERMNDLIFLERVLKLGFCLCETSGHQTDHCDLNDRLA